YPVAAANVKQLARLNSVQVHQGQAFAFVVNRICQREKNRGPLSQYPGWPRLSRRRLGVSVVFCVCLADVFFNRNGIQPNQPTVRVGTECEGPIARSLEEFVVQALIKDCPLATAEIAARLWTRSDLRRLRAGDDFHDL